MTHGTIDVLGHQVSYQVGDPEGDDLPEAVAQPEPLPPAALRCFEPYELSLHLGNELVAPTSMRRDGNFPTNHQEDVIRLLAGLYRIMGPGWSLRGPDGTVLIEAPAFDGTIRWNDPLIEAQHEMYSLRNARRAEMYRWPAPPPEVVPPPQAQPGNPGYSSPTLNPGEIQDAAAKVPALEAEIAGLKAAIAELAREKA